MAEQKTKPTEANVDLFLKAIPEEQRRADAFAMLEIMQEVTGAPPKMWGPSIVGFGEYHYVYASGHEGDSPLAGFSPRKAALTIYLCGLQEQFTADIKKLGKVKASKGCLYIKKLADVDLAVLRKMIRAGVTGLSKKATAAGKKAAKKKPAKK